MRSCEKRIGFGTSFGISLDGDRDPDVIQDIDYTTIEVGNGLRLEWKLPHLAPAGARDEAVADEVKLDLEYFTVGRDW